MSEMNSFKTGDVVKLKSGGPDMTVKDVHKDIHDNRTGTYRCQWFAGKKLEDGVFPHESLVSVTTEQENG